MEKPLQFHPNPRLPQAVQDRLASACPGASARAEEFSRRTKPLLGSLTERGNAIRRSSLATTQKVAALWDLADEVTPHTKGLVACRKSCSHCCNIGVVLMEPEAQLIGERIGVRPRRVTVPEDQSVPFPYGYDNPCSFLRNGQCSIYEHRPLVCRLQFSVDLDDLLCQLHPPEAIHVPYLDMSSFHQLELSICLSDELPMVADIRRWFPHGRRYAR